MTQDITGRGDPIKTLQLLWGKVPEAKRGPKPKLDIETLVAAAIRLADTEGLEAVSTRRVAELVGISPMSFYTYVPGKDELLDLMVDRVHAEFVPTRGPGWRARLSDLAHQYWDFHLRHPWLRQAATHRAVLGPNVMAAWEIGLASIDGYGLGEVELDMVVTSIAAFVSGAVGGAARERMVKDSTGMTDEQWWYASAPFLETLDYSPYPIASRVGPIMGELYGAHAPVETFEFGLALLLDGLAVLIEGRT